MKPKLVNDICTLVDMVIANLTWTNLVSWATSSHMVVEMVRAQAKQKKDFTIMCFLSLPYKFLEAYINK